MMNEAYEISEQIDSTTDSQVDPGDDSTEICESAEDTSEDSNAEGAISEDKADDAQLILALRKELTDLKRELESSRAAYDRLSSECADFSQLYPEVSVTALPDSVWKSFKSGVPLAAAYALYEKREKMSAAKAENINAKNKELSSGSLESSKSEEFYSPAEVRAMSAAEVRANYAKIITSMSKWH